MGAIGTRVTISLQLIDKASSLSEDRRDFRGSSPGRSRSSIQIDTCCGVLTESRFPILTEKDSDELEEKFCRLLLRTR